MEPRGEHPHRCRAGHRWQHTGLPAAACEIPAYDPVTGDLPLVPKSACPVCSGRQDLLVRALHPHYCNLCDGEWDHEGVCVDSLAAYCPWCLPKSDLERAPGARRGPHFHYCSECGQNWQHEAGCSAPLRVALPECTACHGTSAHLDEVGGVDRSSEIHASVDKTFHERIRPFALPIGLAAGVLLSLPIVFKGYSALRGPTADSSISVEARRAADSRPAPVRNAPTATEPTPDVPRPQVEPHPASSIQTRAPVSPPPAPRARAPRAEARREPAFVSPAEQHAPSRPEARRAEPTSRPPDDVRTAPPTPTQPAARSKRLAEAAPKMPPAASESEGRATPVAAALPSIPGAPPFGELTGSSARDHSLDGHPRRVAR
jgi:hypothetical protein